MQHVAASAQFEGDIHINITSHSLAVAKVFVNHALNFLRNSTYIIWDSLDMIYSKLT
jgi:hypothetical protein